MRKAHVELASEVSNGLIERWCLAEYVVHNNSGIRVWINSDAMGLRNTFPRRIEVVDEYDEDNRSINWSERHDQPSEFRTIGACKC